MDDLTCLAREARNRAVELAGGQAALARELKITRSAVHHWDVVPSQQAGRVSAITGIPLHELRPDLFPSPAKPEQPSEAA